MRFPWSVRARDVRDAELDEEVRAHLAMAIADRIARGESPKAAAAAARREFGNVGHVKEVTRETWGGVWLDRLRQDIRYAVRSLVRSPGFATTAVLTLALGIGANTAMFTVVNAVLLRPLPFRDPGALYLVSHEPTNSMIVREPAMLDRQYVGYRAMTRAFERTTSYNAFPATLTDAGAPSRIPVAAVTAGFFEVFGASPAIGHVFTSDEHRSGNDHVVILGDALWRERFGADRAVIGKSLMLDGERRTIVGVMPPRFDFPSGARLWFPTDYTYDPRRVALRPVIGRLASGATPSDALRELKAFFERAERERPIERIEHASSEVIPLRQRIVGDVQRSLLLFAGAVAFVLLIACANVANLLLMRASTRQHEIGIRAAIGAERPRLVRQLLTESLVLAFAGGIAAIVVAFGGVRALLALAPADLLPRAGEIHLDTTSLVVTGLVCAAAGVGFGIVPALHATRGDLRRSLGASRGVAGVRRARLRNLLATSECALAMVLLVGAGLLVRSLVKLHSIDLGFRPENVVTFSVDLSEDRYSTAESMQEFRDRTEKALARLLGATMVSTVNWRPLSQSTVMGDFRRSDGRELPEGFVVLKPSITPDYFRVMGIRVREGRAFTTGDDAAAPGVVVVSRLVADRLWPGGDAVGQRISMEDRPIGADWLTIVGIVDDVVQFGIREARVPAMYRPLSQVRGMFMLSHLNFAIRTDGNPARVEQSIRDLLRTIDPLQPVESIASMQAVVALSIAEPVFQTRLLAAFALLAVMLAAVGIYGVLAYAVTERSQEIGIRLALGATPDAAAWLVVRRTLALAVSGIVIGLIAAAGLTRLLGKLLFEISPTDPWTFGAVALVLVAIAIAAGVTPARRASRLDPMTALRIE